LCLIAPLLEGLFRVAWSHGAGSADRQAFDLPHAAQGDAANIAVFQSGNFRAQLNSVRGIAG